MQHVAGELFMMMSGVNLQHVPYRGGAPALTDLIRGQVQVIAAPLPESGGPHVLKTALAAGAVFAVPLKAAAPESSAVAPA